MKKTLSVILIGITLMFISCEYKEILKYTELEEIENKPSSSDKRHKIQEKRLKNNIKKF